MQKGKTPGAYKLTPDVLKQAWESSSTFQQALLEIIVLCLTKAVFPLDWKHADVLMIPKSGSKDARKTSLYCPISLLCITEKLCESFVKIRMLWEIECKALSQQFALRHGSSAIQAVLVLLQKFRDAMAKQRKIALLTIDVQGAFNQINQKRLIQVLSLDPLNLHSGPVPVQILCLMSAANAHIVPSSQ